MSRAPLYLPTDARLGVVGRTGTGKSVMARYHFTRATGRKVVVDPADDDSTEARSEHYNAKLFPAREDEEWITTHSPEPKFTKEQKCFRVVPEKPRDPKFYDALYQHLFEVGHLTVWTDEMNLVAPTHRIPDGVMQLQWQGRKRHIAHIACSPSPYGVDPDIWRAVGYWAVYDLSWKPDRDRVAQNCQLRIQDLERYLSKFSDDVPGGSNHGFLWWKVAEKKGVNYPAGLPSLEHMEKLRAERSGQSHEPQPAHSP